MAARRFENVALPGETRQVAIDTKAAAALPPVHSAHQDRRRDAAVLCQLVGCQKAEWVAGVNASFRALAGSEGPSATRAQPAQRKPCYTFRFAVETLLATSSRQRQAAGGVKRHSKLGLYGFDFEEVSSCAVSFQLFLCSSRSRFPPWPRRSIRLLSKT